MFVRKNYVKNERENDKFISKMVWIRIDKIREDEEKNEEWY